MARIAVLGAGAWGTAIACTLADRHEVTLWARRPEHGREIAAARRNERYLPGVELPASLTIASELASSIARAALTLVATPVAGLRHVVERVPAGTPLVWLCKGFEEETSLLPHQVVEQVHGRGGSFGALSGPSFAEEVARGLPCALTLAARVPDFARETASLLHGGRMRVYYSTDLPGVEIGGAVKNVMAIAAGISDGLALGHNARAALVTRGLAEIGRLSAALGGRTETVMGLAGAGDLILTTTGDLSRNRRVGLELARGRALRDVLAGLGHIAEGVRSAKEVARLAQQHAVEMPVTEAVTAVLAGALSPQRAVEQLLARDPKEEGGSSGGPTAGGRPDSSQHAPRRRER